MLPRPYSPQITWGLSLASTAHHDLPFWLLFRLFCRCRSVGIHPKYNPQCPVDPTDEAVSVGFDNMCGLAVKLPRWWELQCDACQLSDTHRLRTTTQRLCVPAMHAKGHCARCQWLNAQYRVAGTGLFQGEVAEVFHSSLRLHNTNFRDQRLMAYRANLNGLIHDIAVRQQAELCTVLAKKEANAWLTYGRTSTQLSDLRKLWPTANEVSWSGQLRESALAAGQDEIAGRAGTAGYVNQFVYIISVLQVGMGSSCSRSSNTRLKGSTGFSAPVVCSTPNTSSQC